MPEEDDQIGVPYIVVVRRGETEVFRTLREHGRAGDLSDVIWDRRTAPRRVALTETLPSDRRQRNRRGPLPITWAPLGFLLVSSACPERPLSRPDLGEPEGLRSPPSSWQVAGG